MQILSAAYYYHGLILDEGKIVKSHGMVVAALQAADEYFKESNKGACEAFNAAHPLSRNPPLWGTMKHLFEKIPKDTSSMVRINRDLYSYDKIMETAPTLPDFAIALKPDEYQLPPGDPSWNENVQLSHIGINQVNPDER
ncbi:uncharacterized protein LOC120158822 [Hibiscus syriacus]|uniref:uncharacterized protein LOC120158822 n=1 Tax=Hibiscus syriacus TaxID=106335 RepID=UPI00192469DE|nr:uncharacterized protein LOC120158822 [Hibiscus syriacus]